MITYELAKQLKESGFPQEQPDMYTSEGDFIQLSERKYLPTLSDLIEACNPTQFDEFGISCGYHDQWEARSVYHGHAIPEVDLCIRGDSPEEAVANLWLALNKK